MTEPSPNVCRLVGVLVVPPEFEPAPNVGGLPPLTRQLLTLASAGCDAVAVLGIDRMPEDARVRVPIVAQVPPHRRALVVRADVASHRSVAPRLAHEAAPGPDEVVRVGHDAAAYYLAGETRTAEVVRALRTGDVAVFDSELPLLGGLSAEFVVAARTPTERAQATERLLDSLIKPTSGIFERLYMRPLSKLHTRLLLDTAITPNQITVVTTLLGLAAAALVALPDRRMVVAGALLHLYMRVVDCIDGELARLRYQGSKLGSWLDPIGDAIGMAAFIAAVCHSLARDGATSVATFGYAGVAAFLGMQVFQWWGSALAETHGSFQGIEWGHRAKERSPVESFVARIELLVRTDAISTFYGLAVLIGALAPLAIGSAIASMLGFVYFASQIVKLRRRVA